MHGQDDRKRASLATSLLQMATPPRAAAVAALAGRLPLAGSGPPYLARLPFCWRSLSIPVETPNKGRDGCSRMTVSPTAQATRGCHQRAVRADGGCGGRCGGCESGRCGGGWPASGLARKRQGAVTPPKCLPPSVHSEPSARSGYWRRPHPGLPSYTMAIYTSDCVMLRFVDMKWP